MMPSLPARGVRVEISSDLRGRPPVVVAPARGVRVEIYAVASNVFAAAGHSPQGECGLKFRLSQRRRGGTRRHSPQGECGLKYFFERVPLKFRSHSPQGECGLKFLHVLGGGIGKQSLPARGVRVEICSSIHVDAVRGHSPQGECGLKSGCMGGALPRERRHSPQRECGLKFGGALFCPWSSRHSPQGECGLKSDLPHVQHAGQVTPRKGSAG